MPIKIITPPDTLTIDIERRLPGGEKETVQKEISFCEFVRENLLSLNHWGNSYPALKSAGAIDKALAEYEGTKVLEGDVPVVELAEEDWERLRATLKEPPQGLGLIPKAGIQLLPYMDAIMDAKTK